MEPLLSSSSTVLARAFNTEAIRSTNQDAKLQTEHYDFQHPAVLRNVPPPTIHFRRPLHWWSLDRRRRLATVMRLRDQLLEDIMRVGCGKAR